MCICQSYKTGNELVQAGTVMNAVTEARGVAQVERFTQLWSIPADIVTN